MGTTLQPNGSRVPVTKHPTHSQETLPKNSLDTQSKTLCTRGGHFALMQSVRGDMTGGGGELCTMTTEILVRQKIWSRGTKFQEISPAGVIKFWEAYDLGDPRSLIYR